MKIDRIHRIYDFLKDVRTASLDTLCETFDVSKNTIRRDIVELERQGLIEKVYGGVVLKTPNEGQPEPFSARETRNIDAKRRIAREAAALVKDGDVIYIDSGTTTMHLIPCLIARHRLTILTASLYVVNACAGQGNFNVICTGGSFYTPSRAFVGPTVLSCIAGYNLTRIFLASTGISLENGATNASQLECEIKRTLMQKKAEKYLLVDTSKIGHSSLMTYAPLKAFDHIIMEQEPPKEYRKFLGEKLLIAKTEV